MPDGAELLLVRNRGAATRSVPAVVTSQAGGTVRLRAVVPLSELDGATDLVNRVGRVPATTGWPGTCTSSWPAAPGQGGLAGRHAGEQASAGRP